MITLSAIVIAHTLLAPQFCEGIRSAETHTGMPYQVYLDEYALPTDVAAKQLITAREEAIFAGASGSGADVIAKQAVARNKIRASNGQARPVKAGQIAKCGKISNNWR